jgi:hypothetical protein
MAFTILAVKGRMLFTLHSVSITGFFPTYGRPLASVTIEMMSVKALYPYSL